MGGGVFAAGQRRQKKQINYTLLAPVEQQLAAGRQEQVLSVWRDGR